MKTPINYEKVVESAQNHYYELQLKGLPTEALVRGLTMETESAIRAIVEAINKQNEQDQ